MFSDFWRKNPCQRTRIRLQKVLRRFDIGGDDSRFLGFSVARTDRQPGELSNEPTRTAVSSRNRIRGSMVGLLPDLQRQADQSEMQVRLLQRQV